MNPEHVRAMMADNEFIRSRGMELLTLEEDRCVGRMPFRAEFTNHLGHMHGGVSYAFADIIAGALAHTNADGAVTTTGGEIHYLKGIYNTEEIYCTAVTIKRGRTLSVYSVRITDKVEKMLYAHGTFTYYSLDRAL